MTKAQLGIVGFFGVLILVVILIFLGVIPGLKRDGAPIVTKTEVNFWGLAEDNSAWADVISRYSAQNPTIQINYRGVDVANYENVLIDALAAGTGPDIFLLRNDWVGKHRNKVFAAPSNLITSNFINDAFPKVVSEDFVSEDGVWGMPVSVETLALAYNRDFFDSRQVAVIPDTWDKIKSIAPRLIDIQSGKMVKSAISMGGTNSSVQNAGDIVILLMLQNGLDILNDKLSSSAFSGPKAVTALKFYTDFSDPSSSHYSLQEGFENSLASFAKGNMAMALVYPADIKTIRGINPTVNMRLVGMPQLDQSNQINIARYWGLTVSSQTRNYANAWNFINFAATDPSAVSAYVLSSGKPPALRSLVNSYANHPTLSIFAPQALNADSSPKVMGDKIREIFSDMIRLVVIDGLSPSDAIDRGASEVNRLLR